MKVCVGARIKTCSGSAILRPKLKPNKKRKTNKSYHQKIINFAFFKATTVFNIEGRCDASHHHNKNKHYWRNFANFVWCVALEDKVAGMRL
jgi:hypothetical protein